MDQKQLHYNCTSQGITNISFLYTRNIWESKRTKCIHAIVGLLLNDYVRQ